VEYPLNYIKTMLGPRERLLDDILRQALLERKMRPMQIDDNAARTIQLITALHKPRKVIELGTYFGYSTIHIARGLPEGGKLVTIENDAEVASLALKNISRARIGHLVDIVVQDAAAFLQSIERESIDMFFIDADKKNYPNYLQICFPLLRNGGIILADDCFAIGNFSGEAVDGQGGHTEVRAINTYNKAVLGSGKLFSAFIGTEHGMLLSIKHGSGSVTGRGNADVADA
jgi:caffeoyl-CoA O-methyltransferase